MAKYVLALDQGTTSSRAIVFDHDGAIVSVAQQEFPQIYPAPGLVEHDPEAIWSSQLAVGRDAMNKAGATASDVAAIGVTNQRETTILWDKNTGRPVFNAIVWQSRLTVPICDALKAKGFDKEIRNRKAVSTSLTPPTLRAPSCTISIKVSGTMSFSMNWACLVPCCPR